MTEELANIESNPRDISKAIQNIKKVLEATCTNIVMLEHNTQYRIPFNVLEVDGKSFRSPSFYIQTGYKMHVKS